MESTNGDSPSSLSYVSDRSELDAGNVTPVLPRLNCKSDCQAMRQADETLAKFGVAHECRVPSAHRTPVQTAEYVVKLNRAACK